MNSADIQKPAAHGHNAIEPRSLLAKAASMHALLVKCAGMLQSPLLLAMRVWWGWSFFLTGKGKLLNHADTADFFRTLGIPLAGLNAWVAGSVESVGGLFLLAGFASRLTAIPLSVTMIVAYLTADNEALKSIFSDTDKFTSATPFLFLLTAVLVFAFGPGAFSVDRLLAWKFFGKRVNAGDGRRD